MNKDTQKNYDNRFIGKLRGKRIECEQKKTLFEFYLGRCFGAFSLGNKF